MGGMWFVAAGWQRLVVAAGCHLSFAEFLAGIKTEALARGIRPEVVDSALAGIDEPSALVIERDRSQAEVVQTLEQYLNQRVTAKTVATGREMLTRSAICSTRSRRRTVPPAHRLDLGFESNFGRFNWRAPDGGGARNAGVGPAPVRSLRRELFDALEILNRATSTSPA
jgi:membrane-bound lytic murein transglycosylase B